MHYSDTTNKHIENSASLIFLDATTDGHKQMKSNLCLGGALLILTLSLANCGNYLVFNCICADENQSSGGSITKYASQSECEKELIRLGDPIAECGTRCGVPSQPVLAVAYCSAFDLEG